MRGHQSANRLNQNARVCIANCARFFIQAALGFPLNTPPPRDKRSLTARGPVRGNPRRARSFGDFAIKSRGKRGSARRVSSIFPLYKSQNEKLLFVYKVTITSRPTALGRDTITPSSNDRAKSSMQNRSNHRNQIIKSWQRTD